MRRDTTTDEIRSWCRPLEATTFAAHVGGWTVPVTVLPGGAYEIGRAQGRITSECKMGAQGAEAMFATALANLCRR